MYLWPSDRVLPFQFSPSTESILIIGDIGSVANVRLIVKVPYKVMVGPCPQPLNFYVPRAANDKRWFLYKESSTFFRTAGVRTPRTTRSGSVSRGGNTCPHIAPSSLVESLVRQFPLNVIFFYMICMGIEYQDLHGLCYGINMIHVVTVSAKTCSTWEL